MNQHVEQLESLKERFKKWNLPVAPRIEHQPRWEQDLKNLLAETVAFCRHAGTESEVIKPQLEAFLGRLDRTYRAISTFPLPPGTHAVLDSSQGAKAGELAEYLRRHGVDATVRTLYGQVQTGWASTFLPFFMITPVYATVPTGIRVGGGGRAYHPATETRGSRKRR